MRTTMQESSNRKLLKFFMLISFTVLFFLDINECLQNSSCHLNATCNNTDGSYVCICDSGYNGDGFTCNGKKTL